MENTNSDTSGNRHNEIQVENPGFAISVTSVLTGHIESIQLRNDATVVNLVFIGATFKGSDYWEVRLLGHTGTILQPDKGASTTSSGGLTEFTSTFGPLPAGETFTVQLAVVPLTSIGDLDSEESVWNDLHILPAQ